MILNGFFLQVLKTRLALRKTNEYTGMADCAKKLYAAEGVRVFYRFASLLSCYLINGIKKAHCPLQGLRAKPARNPVLRRDRPHRIRDAQEEVPAGQYYR